MRIAVASGKGGTGKTTVALGLALAGDGVTLVDCDVEEPDDHIFLGGTGELVEEVTIPVARVHEDLCTHCGECARQCPMGALAVLRDQVMVMDQQCKGCGLCAVVCPEGAIREEPRRIGEVRAHQDGGLRLMTGLLDVGEPFATPLIRRLKQLAGDGGLQVLDAPPGTACSVVQTLRGADHVLLVTEPTPFGLYDLRLAVDLVREMDLPLGVVVNRDRPGWDRLDRYLEDEDLMVLLRIPDDIEIARLYSRGLHFAGRLPGWAERFEALLEDVTGGRT